MASIPSPTAHRRKATLMPPRAQALFKTAQACPRLAEQGTHAKLSALLMLTRELLSYTHLALAACPLLSCVSASEISEAPDTAELRALFVEPTGAITAENIEALISNLRSIVPSQDSSKDTRFMESLLPEIEGVIAPAGALNIAKLELELLAQMKLTITCDAASKGGGELEVSFLFAGNAIVPTLWGELHDCRQAPVAINGQKTPEVRYDGRFLVALDNTDDFSIDPDEWTLSFEGTQSLEGKSLPLRFEVEKRGARFRFPVPLGDGTWALLTVNIDTQDLLVEDTLGTYVCTPKKSECLTDDHPIGSFEY